MVVKLLPHLAGLLGMLAVVAGVWGLFGWQWGVISAGLPFAAFWLYGEARSAGALWRRMGDA